MAVRPLASPARAFLKRHHLLSTALGFVSASAVAAAFVLGGDATSGASASGASAPAATTTTTGVAMTSTMPIAPLEPAGIGVLTATLDTVWAQTYRPTTSCLMVLHGGRVLFERNPDTPVVPASAMKLVTATAALRELGPRTRLRTRVMTAAPPAAGVVDGDLYLVGGGDPVLGTRDWAARVDGQTRLHTSIETLADAVVAAGIRHVRGSVVGDEHRYDAERYVASWPVRYHNDNETGPLSALSVNDGFAVYGRDGEDGTPWTDPPRDAASMLTMLLAARGVAVDGAPAAGIAPPSAAEVAGIDSPTVARLAAAMLLDSDNRTAELLVKEIGLRAKGAGSTAAGVEAVTASLMARRLPMSGVVVRDGSGLDRGNAVTCRLLAEILTDAPAPIDAGLPVAGQTGTLRRRFEATPVAGHLRAKTGSLGGVASLAGFADGPSGELTFVHVLNGIQSYGGAIRVQDALGAALVGGGGP